MNSYIYADGEKRDNLESYKTSYQFGGTDPLPRIGDRIITEWVGQAKWDPKKGDKIRCFEYEVEHIIFDKVHHEIQVHCKVLKDEFRYWKYNDKKDK